MTTTVLTVASPGPPARPRLGIVSDPVRLVAIRDTPLDVTEVVDSLGDEGAGGLTLFIGQVRDHDAGKGVTALDYSAHPTALARLEDVCRRVGAPPDAHAVSPVNPGGPLPVGD